MAHVPSVNVGRSVPQVNTSYSRRSSGFRAVPTIPFQISIPENLRALGTLRGTNNNVTFKAVMTSQGPEVDLYA